MPKPLRWGIIGTGNIAGQFCAGMASSQRGRLVAAASRSSEAAAAFAQRYAIPAAYSGYQQLLNDAQIDAVYISLPNSMHHEWTIKSLRSGRHVLCEKPFAMNTQQCEEMFDVAERTGVLVAEAFMYLSHPQTMQAVEAVHRGDIGELRLVRSSFCYRTRRIEGNIRFQPALGGGAMMDVGCYCTSLAALLADADPVEIHVGAKLHQSGVDEAAAGLLRFGSGVLASFTCGMTLQADNTAYLCGTEGFIEIPVPWKPPPRDARWVLAQSTPPKQDAPKGVTPSAPPRQVFSVNGQQDLYALEADDFASSVLDGLPLRVPKTLTLRNMRILDEIRRQIDLQRG